MKKFILIVSVLMILLVGFIILCGVMLYRQYFEIIPDTEKTYSGTILDIALYPHEITPIYSIARSQIGIDLDHCEECSICYDHYFTISKHCTDTVERGDSVILTVARERGTGVDVVIGITPQNGN